MGDWDSETGLPSPPLAWFAARIFGAGHASHSLVISDFLAPFRVGAADSNAIFSRAAPLRHRIGL